MLCCALAAGVLGGFGGAASAAEPSVTRAGPVPPAQWPASALAAPGIEGWPNALRIWGPDRYQTSLAGSLVLRGSGSFPFDTPDRTGGAAGTLGSADHWWGLGMCPKAVVIVAGDSQADALAAAALSDPTGGSSEPYVRRVAAADPLFDPPGGFARVDTHGAPVLVTDSIRTGARSLAVPVRLAVQDLRSGGCSTARQAIIVGGPAAVATEIEAELVSIGITEVFRVAGANRYGTAAAVAHALGTAPVPDDAAGCAATRGSDSEHSRRPPQLAFWANSVVEWRDSPTQCRLLGRTVVLTDGIEGIDALAAGWWTSYWQVPVLLSDGRRRLPAETVAAMTLLDIDHIIAVGGTARLPDDVVDEAARLTGAQTFRVSGSNRYATSVEMAKYFGGWWPNADLADGGFESAVMCVAASGGARSSLGWPDALGAGAWCGTAAAVGAAAPGRVLGAVNSSRPPTVAAADVTARDGGPAGRGTPAGPNSAAVPLILVPSGSDQLPPSVELYLEEMFSAPAGCVAFAGEGAMGSDSDVVAYAAALENGTCPAPGFAVAFGGPEAVTPAMLGNLSSILSGRLTSAAVPEVALAGAETPDPQSSFGISSVSGVPLGVGAYATTLAMTPVFHSNAGGGSVRVCVPRGSYPNARWLNVEGLPAGAPLGAVDLTGVDWYRSDHDGEFRSVGEGAPGCVELRPPAGVPLLLRAVDPLGRSSRTLLVVDDVDRRFGVTAPLAARNPETSGLRSDVGVAPGVTRWVFETGAVAASAEIGDAAEPIVGSRLQIDLRRRAGTGGGPGTTTFRAEWFIRTAQGRAGGTADGEAVLRGGKWWLRGASVLTGGNWASSMLGSPGNAVPEPFDPVGPPPIGAVVPPLRVGTSGGYGAGGFSAEITLHGRGSDDDTISWQLEAFINVAGD